MGVADGRTDEDGLIDADTKHVCTNRDLWPVRLSRPPAHTARLTARLTPSSLACCRTTFSVGLQP